MSPKIATFVSAHGFGHAARTCGVIEATRRARPGTQFELFTTVPEWFFEQSLSEPTGYHQTSTDLGLVQQSSLVEDLRETLRQLEAWIPFRDQQLNELASAVDGLGCDRVLCDISPLGLAVAQRCGLPALLVENFTWDWIYRGYTDTEPAFSGIADYLSEVFDFADVRIQAEPFCRRADGALSCAPISRLPRRDRITVRRQLRIPLEARIVMLTMGGVEWDYEGIDAQLERLEDFDPETWLIVPGSTPKPRRVGQAVLLPHRSDFFHPDLIQASDAVIGKLGYSTIAEVTHAGVPFGYVPRPSFPESPPLEAWVREHLPHRRISADAFVAWGWLDEIEPLLSQPRSTALRDEGGGTVAQHLLSL
ncbi:MAG: hypothetical protein AAF560_03180 [Acidobacteriota bacterium]